MRKHFRLVFGLGLVVVACSGVAEPEMAQELDSFFDQNPEFGNLVDVRAAPSWAHGARKTVATETGEYLVYFKGGDIIGVFTFAEHSGRVFLTGTCYRGDIEFTVTRRSCRSLFSRVGRVAS